MSSFSKPVAAIRIAGGHDDGRGHWVEGEAEAFVIGASVQPVKPKELEALPDGARGAGKVVKIYTSALLSPASREKGTSGDQITYLGRQYEIIGAEDHQMGVISHYKYFATEVTKG